MKNNTQLLQENVCKNCGNCCKYQGKFLWLELYTKELGSIIGSEILFKIVDSIYWWTYRQKIKNIQKRENCMFLRIKNNKYKCLIYPIRPSVCRNYVCDKIGLSNQ